MPADSVGSHRCCGAVSLLLLFPAGLCGAACFLGGMGSSAGWQGWMLLLALSRLCGFTKRLGGGHGHPEPRCMAREASFGQLFSSQS